MMDFESREYWDRKAECMAAESTAAAEYAKSEAGQMEAAQRRLNALTADQSAHTDAEIAEVLAQIEALKAAEAARFAAEWTREVTTTRRAGWNTLVKSGKLDMALVRKAERAQGWTRDDLKRAVALHKL